MKDIKAKTKALQIIKQTQMGTLYTWGEMLHLVVWSHTP